MRLAVVQCPSIGADVQANLARLVETVRTAAICGAELVVFPEMYVTGYNIGERDVRSLAEPVDGPAIAFIRQVARDASVHVCVGYPELGDGGKIYNSAVICDPRGQAVLNYRKSHLFGAAEKKVFSPADRQTPLVRVNGITVGVLICYDVEFPENTRAAAQAGADIVVVPTANMEPFRSVSEIIVPARSYENQMYVAYANYCGDQDGLAYCGRSTIADPNGVRLASAGDGPDLLFAEIDREVIRASRSKHCFLDDCAESTASAF
ncbi:carbon-nitrogen hydrolase [Mycobacterium sp. 852013-50091_SCH5140682]|nr:carbon-nitrogen hydrolase [Mycobacterium sp. 852013-50091_SCH5140682]